MTEIDKALPTSSAVDTTGDLSRKVQQKPHHSAEVGPALSSPAYRPGQSNDFSNKVVHNPMDYIIVLGTPDSNGRTEYRVGSFPNEDVLKRGLCFQDEMGIRLKPQVAQRCFAGSNTYYDRSEAISAAQATYPELIGIKVMRLPCPFPV